MNEVVKQMIADALINEGVEELFKQNGDGYADVFNDENMAKIDKIKQPNTKIKLLQQLLAKAIQEFKKTNRAKGVDFSKRLNTLIDEYNERKDFEVFQSDVLDDVAQQFADLFKDLQTERSGFADLGIDVEEKAFYDILEAIAKKHEFEYPHEKLIELSKAVKVVVDDKAQYADWSHRDDIKAGLKVDLILILNKHGYPPVTKDEVFKEILEQAENFK
jgi:type I restriction enzyme R subunit